MSLYHLTLAKTDNNAVPKSDCAAVHVTQGREPVTLPRQLNQTRTKGKRAGEPSTAVDFRH